MDDFKKIDLPEKLHGALESMGFSVPTPIQAQAIPVVLDRRDLVGCAQTGTGKTAAFCVPLITHLLNSPQGQSALILTPTRELAFQIVDVLKQMTMSFPRLRPTLLIGGAPMYRQIRALQRKPALLVGTPGRVIDHLTRRHLSVSSTKMVVLDEADRMLDMGFEAQLREIFRYLPKARQTLLFSATYPKNIKNLAKKYLTNPVHVSVGQAQQPVEEIRQSSIQTTDRDKNKVLLKELGAREGSVLIFARTKRRTDRLSQFLKDRRHNVGRIHGGLSQRQRSLAMEHFRSNRHRILVATDLASRGLDIDHIKHVINYDLPRVPEDYIHRVGRTARAGAQGEALSLLVPDDYDMWRKISHLYKIEGEAMASPAKPASHGQGPRRSRRHKKKRFYR